jgi:hypothetical protein
MPDGEAEGGRACVAFKARDRATIAREFESHRNTISDFAKNIEKGMKVSQSSMNREIKI